MSELKVLDEEVRLKPSPDPWILRAIEHIKKPDPTPWILISAIASHISEDRMSEIVMQVMDSEIKYLQESLGIIKMACDMSKEIFNSTELGKPSPDQMKKIVMQVMDSEIKYLQDGIATRKMIYDMLNPRPEPPKQPR